MIPFIDLKSQYQAYKEEIDTAIAELIQSASFIGGAKLEEFEAHLAQYVGVKHAIGCSSGTSALLLALLALGIQKGDEIIVPSFTFIATAEMVAFIGAKPVFADISLEDFNADKKCIEKLITAKTKAFIAVSMFGQMPNLEELKSFCEYKNIALIEDGAQSFGASMQLENGNFAKSCSLAHISCTSFFPSKPLGAYGDAGAVFTNDEALAKRIKIFLNHGQIARYQHEVIGFNGRLDTLQAAILNVKLRHLDEELALREQRAKIYLENLQNCVLPKLKEGFRSAWAQFSVRVQDRAKVIQTLQNAGIPSAIHYPLGLHLQVAFKDLGYNKGDLPNTELVSEQILSLPMSAFLNLNHQEQVINAFKKGF